MGGNVSQEDTRKKRRLNSKNPVVSVFIMGVTWKLCEQYAKKETARRRAAEEKNIEYYSDPENDADLQVHSIKDESWEGDSYSDEEDEYEEPYGPQIKGVELIVEEANEEEQSPKFNPNQSESILLDQSEECKNYDKDDVKRKKKLKYGYSPKHQKIPSLKTKSQSQKKKMGKVQVWWEISL